MSNITKAMSTIELSAHDEFNVRVISRFSGTGLNLFIEYHAPLTGKSFSEDCTTSSKIYSSTIFVGRPPVDFFSQELEREKIEKYYVDKFTV